MDAVLDKDLIESYAGTSVRLTTIDDLHFEGVLWMVYFMEESEAEIDSILLHTERFAFKPEHIKKIESIERKWED
ncbi:MAG TPA: hypothetical protein PKH65_10755 [Bacteroidia bacterium]|nr:hypothetical protein [Bacteroidia bacterium]HNT81149.1 hypothetical protein [Bacteroidia bacterium]